MDDGLIVTSAQRRLLRRYRRWGPVALIWATSVGSVIASVLMTGTVLWVFDGTQSEIGTSLLIAALVPMVIAPVASGVLVNLLGAVSRAYDQLATAASTDPLTGLANRRRFFLEANRMVASLATGEELLVAMIDIDHFKAINDLHGHAAGDASLQTLADRLSDAVGGAGIAGRLGGDEFACVLPVIAHPSFAPRDAVRAACAHATSGTAVRVGASVGFATVHRGADINEGLAEADAALYRAKGRRDPDSRTVARTSVWEREPAQR